MKTTRRKFLTGLIIGTAMTMSSLRLAPGPLTIPGQDRYLWDRLPEGWQYGINPEMPWDVLVYSDRLGRFMEPEVLVRLAADGNEEVVTTLAGISMSQGYLAVEQGYQEIEAGRRAKPDYKKVEKAIGLEELSDDDPLPSIAVTEDEWQKMMSYKLAA